MGLVKKRGWFYWVKRVPERYSGLVLGANGKPVQQVRQSLGTQSKSVAMAKAAQIEAITLAEWEAMAAGQTDDARRHFQASVNLAKAAGFQYQPAEHLLSKPIEEILPRLLAATGSESQSVPTEVTKALLGTVTPIYPTLSGVLDEYFDLTKTRHLKKSDRQRHLWTLSRQRATKNASDAIANGGQELPVDQIAREDVLRYRKFWSDRVEAGTHNASSANKEFGIIAEIFGTWAELTNSPIPNPFKKIRLDGETTKRHPPFSRTFVAQKILADGALDALNEEARDVLLVMVNTGLRPSEITDAPLSDFRVDHEIPHLRVAAHGRELKVAHTARDIPLLGVSLAAARRIVERNGIQRYKFNASSWSAIVGKYMKNNGLKESPAHTPYSLRHYIEDALLTAGVDDRVRADIMGHKYTRPVYGAGGGLAARAAALGKIAL